MQGRAFHHQLMPFLALLSMGPHGRWHCAAETGGRSYYTTSGYDMAYDVPAPKHTHRPWIGLSAQKRKRVRRCGPPSAHGLPRRHYYRQVSR